MLGLTMFIARWILVVSIGLGLLAAILVSAERAQPAPSAIGAALGISGSARLPALADAGASGRRPPSAADLAFVRRAATSMPLSPLPFFILGATHQARDAPAAVAAAVVRDPRFRPAYGWQASADAAAGDVAGATRALLRIGALSPTDPRIWGAVAALTADPVARGIIVPAVARNPAWRETYLSQLSGSQVDRAIVFAVLQQVQPRLPHTSAAAVAPDDHRAFIDALIARKDYERAYLAWVQWLPSASQASVGLVFDGDFRGHDALPPFSWQLASEATGGSVTLDPKAGLTIDYFGSDAATPVQQTLVLTPGRYRMTTTADFASGTADDGAAAFAWTVTCLPDASIVSTVAVPLAGATRTATGQTFELGAPCRAQVLALRIAPADVARRLTGTVRSVKIEAVK